LIVFIFSVIGFFLLLLIQTKTETWIYSTKNFIVEECHEETKICKTAIAYSKILQLLLASPIIEEIVLRVILFTLYFSRCEKFFNTKNKKSFF
jgi:membrane protease YdiL (CAAX protease family)